MVKDVIISQSGNEHLDIIQKGIDNRMDIYKLFFVLTQIFALIFLTVSVLKRNKELHAKFVARVKLRLVQMNLEGN